MFAPGGVVVCLLIVVACGGRSSAPSNPQDDGGESFFDAKPPRLDAGPVLGDENSAGPCVDTPPPPFNAVPIHPPTTPQAACSDAQLGALADACLEDPASTKSTACKDARALEANKPCTECVFGVASDANWKVINVEEGKTAQFNQAGCITHVTGVPGCGEAYIQILRCVNHYCPSDQCTDPPPGNQCLEEVRGKGCKQFTLGNDVSSDDVACTHALQDKQSKIDESCFAADNTPTAEKTFFINMAKTSCASPSPDGG